MSERDIPEQARLLGTRIAERLSADRAALSKTFAGSGTIRHFVVDGLLGEEAAAGLAAKFPASGQMHLRNSFRERKFVSAQMDRHPEGLEAALFAFHEETVVEAVRSIVGKADIYPDPELYAGGISLMGPRHFLNPHVDNSHDGQRLRWRNLNLLYYISPGWAPDDGGALELWNQGMRDCGLTIHAAFDRLVVMETHQHAWHSVSPIAGSANGNRLCISNYYFGDSPMREDQRFHVTRFRGRPGQPIGDLLARSDGALRMVIRKIAPGGLVRSGHRYKS